MLEKKDLEMISEIMKPITEKIDTIERKISDIQLTLENETNRNISIIAENHVELNKKLNEAIKIDSEKELLLIRVNRLENELRRIKDQLNRIA